MPSIRDLVAAIRQRDGVEAVVVVGNDGLLIDGQADGVDTDDLAARIPPLVSVAGEIGAGVGRGALVSAVLEHEGGLAIVSVLSGDATLVVLVAAHSDVGQLLFEIRRNREHIAALI